MPKKEKDKLTPVETIVHKKDKRTNIPTRELADFVVKEEEVPYIKRYPRDSSLDPQLVWKGKDEQDSQNLSIPTVPIYIQEKISPQALIENLRQEQKREKPEPQANLFADFNGIEFEKLVEFYRHEQNWSNRLILGDSLLVINSLAEKEGLKGKVQMIYIDPPYGIKFGSNWQVSTRKRDVKDGKAEDAIRQPEQIKAFRDTWKLGIHSYLSYLRDRLVIARELLTETGSVFVQIGDENVHLVRCLLDEVFGSENAIGLIPFRKKTMPLGAKYLDTMNDFLLWYGKDKERLKYKQLFLDYDPEGKSRWTWYETSDGERKTMTTEEAYNHDLLPKGARVFRLVSLRAPGYSEENDFSIIYKGEIYFPPKGGSWITGREEMQRLISTNRLQPEGGNISYTLFADDFPLSKLTNFWIDTTGPQKRQFVVETDTIPIQRCLLMTTDPSDLVLDPTCGSGTTAYVAEQWGRRWITIDTSRVALTVARTRLMSARYPYYLLADSPEGVEKEAELTGKIPVNQKLEGDIKKGFVYKRVPHITLKSIANNPDIKEAMTREEIDLTIARHACRRYREPPQKGYFGTGQPGDQERPLP